jgi:Spy/CpxP family protein refolding chaperone
MTKFPRQKWLLLLVAILLITNIITLSIFWSTKRPDEQHRNEQNQNPGDRQRRMGQFMVNELKLDKEQEAVYWKLRDTLVNQQRPVMDSIRVTKQRFFALLQDPSPSDAVLKANMDEIGELQKKLDLITFQHFQQVRALCKPEQVLKMDTVVKEIVNRMTGSWRSPGKNGAPKDSAAKK